MFYNLPHRRAGFTDDEWSKMTSGVKRIIRDFYLNGRSQEETEKYEYYETDFRVRRVIKQFNLHQRPAVIVRAEDLSLC